MSLNISFFLRLLFWISGIVSIYAKFVHNIPLNNLTVPFFTLTLLLNFYLEKGKTNIFYFSFSFCLAGDLMVMSDDIYYFISGLMAYWGATILFSIALSRELERPLSEAIKTLRYGWPFLVYLIYFFALMVVIHSKLGDLFIPISIYALTLSFNCALGLSVYLQKPTYPIRCFSVGLVLLSIAATFIGLNRFYLDNKELFVFETIFYVPTLYCIYLYFKANRHVEN